MDLAYSVSAGGDGNAGENLEDSEHSPSVYRDVARPLEKLALGAEVGAVSGSSVAYSRKREVRKEQRMFCSGTTSVECPFVPWTPVRWG